MKKKTALILSVLSSIILLPLLFYCIKIEKQTNYYVISVLYIFSAIGFYRIMKSNK